MKFLSKVELFRQENAVFVPPNSSNGSVVNSVKDGRSELWILIPMSFTPFHSISESRD